MPLLFAMMFASQLATTIFLPGLPGIAEDLHATLSAAQMMLPAYLGAFAIAQLAVGPLSDAFGRRRVIIGGLGLFSLTSLMAALAPNIEMLLAARALQASGACATMVVARAIIRDTTQGAAATRAMSALAIAMAVGPSAAPFIGGHLVTWFNWRATFFFTALISAITTLGVLRYLEETLPTDRRRAVRLGGQFVIYLRLFGKPVFVGYSLIVSFASGAMQAFLAASPIILILQMGMPPAIYGFCVMLMPLIYIVGSYLAGRLTLLIPIDSIVLIGAFASAGGGLLQLGFGLRLAPFDISPMHILLAFAISNMGTGLVLAPCYSRALDTVSPSYAGAASALSGFIHMGWAFAITLTVASVAHETSLPFGVAQMTTTGLSLTAALILIFVYKRRTHTGA
ncbi:MAG: multidrug effflux MFS transporter [Alphaproteobacteria bacterium]